ncbi:MAG TPA: NAD-dependent epimerase/dehydratase family protein [Euzebyales bacterium]
MDVHGLRGSRVVVLGAAGFLGSHLCERLLTLGAHVTAIDNFITGRKSNLDHLIGGGALRLVYYDVTDFLHVPGDVDAILHFASPASPIDYLRWPIQTLKVGSLGTHKALGLARAKDARLLLASTSEVYGDPRVSPQPEDYWGNVNPIGPRGVYDEAKRFAEAMALAYHREHGVKVRIARIFNSILADEQVLYDDGTALRREPIGALASRVGDRVDLVGYAVPAFDADGTVAASEAIALEGHPTGARCYEVRTRYGRSIRVTGDHSLFAEGSDGRPVARTVDELRVGDHIAIASRVEVPARDRTGVDMTQMWRSAGRDPWDLMVRAPGIGDAVFARRHELAPALVSRGRPRQQCWNTVNRWRKQDEAPLGALEHLSMPIPADAYVRLAGGGTRALMPSRVAVTDEFLWLLGLYTAAGALYRKRGKNACVTIPGNDADLRGRARKVFERDLNLHVVDAVGSDDRPAAIFVHAELLLCLLEHLDFPTDDKAMPGWILGLPLERLAWFLEGYREGDGVHSGSKIQQQRHEFSTTSTRLKDDLIVALARYGIVPSVGRFETTARQRTGDRRYPFWRLTVCNVDPWSPLGWADGTTQRLNARRHGDLVWARVTAIQEIPATDIVYDFCVPGRENFWAGSGVMAHNTYGPRMRVEDGRAVPAFFAAALRNEPLPVHGDGSQTRSLCYVDDEVEGLLRLLVSDEVGPVNIGNPEEHTILELAEMIQDVVGNHPGIAFHPRPIDDPTVRRPDIALARKVLDWEPAISLRDGLERTLPWFAENDDRAS